MKRGLPGVPGRLRRQFVIVMLTGIVALIAFYPLESCASSGSVPGARTTPTQRGTATSGATPTAGEMETSVAIPTQGGTAASGATPTQGGTGTPVAPSTPQVQPTLWRLAWSDEFNGPSGAPPDSSIWGPDVGGGGAGNRQLEYDTNNQNAYQDGQGHLILEARRNNPAGYQCWYGRCEYTSAQVSTSGRFSFTYGLLEASIKIPYGQGIWSSFWLLGANCQTVGWPTCGEIDIMENIGKHPGLIYGTVHGPATFSGTYKLAHGAFSDSFHRFALQWDPNHLYFFVDGINYYTVKRATMADQGYWVYDHPFSIILSAPVGGVWPGSPDSTTIFPQKMSISYVRLYTKPR